MTIRLSAVKVGIFCLLGGGLGISSSVLHPQGANALIVSVPGYGVYDIITDETYYDANPTRFQSQQWWGSQLAANEFGNAWLSASTSPDRALFAYNYTDDNIITDRIFYINCLAGDNC